MRAETICRYLSILNKFLKAFGMNPSTMSLWGLNIENPRSLKVRIFGRPSIFWIKSSGLWRVSFAWSIFSFLFDGWWLSSIFCFQPLFSAYNLFSSKSKSNYN